MTRDSWGAQTLGNLSGLSQKWQWQLENNQNPVSLATIHEALLQQMRSHREGVRNRLQPKDVNAVKDQFFQKRRNSSVADISSPAPRRKCVRTAGILSTIEVASSSNTPAAATESNDQNDLPLDPALLQISVGTFTADETEVRGSETSPQPSPASRALLQTREPTQALSLDAQDATTKNNAKTISDFLTESGSRPDRSRSMV